MKTRFISTIVDEKSCCWWYVKYGSMRHSLWWIFIRCGNYYAARAQWRSQHKWETGSDRKLCRDVVQLRNSVCCGVLAVISFQWRDVESSENQFHWWSEVHPFQFFFIKLNFHFGNSLRRRASIATDFAAIIIMHAHGSKRSNQHPWLLSTD